MSSRAHLKRSEATLQRSLDAWYDTGRSIKRGSELLGMAEATLQHHIRDAKKRGLVPTREKLNIPRGPTPDSPEFAAQQGDAPEYDLVHRVPDGMTLKGTSLRYDANGNVDQYWNKTKPQGLAPEDAVQLPDPKKIEKVSTLFDQQGRVTQQWVSERHDAAQRETLWQEYAKALAQDLPRAQPVPAPDVVTDTLATLLPVGDHHFGMMSWREETGADYDLAIAEKLLFKATDYLLAAAPACEQAFIVFLGDLQHYDSFDAVTPTSRNLLDADGRFPKMVRVAIRSMRYMIETALLRHKHVHVIVEIGNHDLSSSIFLMECMSNIYENEPRITIDTSPSHYHYFSFGKCLVGTHHGHGAKMEKLPLIMASDRPAEWGAAEYRYWLTGHIHSRTAQDYSGCTVESFRVLAPTDAWASQKGYRSARDMKCLILHKEYGEVARHTVNPMMIFNEGSAIKDVAAIKD